MSILNQNDSQWKNIYLFGAISAIIAIIGSISDIIIGSMLSDVLGRLPEDAVGRFELFNNNVLLGLYSLDVLTMCINIFIIPVFYAVVAVHRHINIALAGLALVFNIIGNAIFITNNAGLPMMELALKYQLETNEIQRTIITSAGEALLVKASVSGSGAFLGFLIPLIADIILSFTMLSGKIFSKTASYFGLFGNTFLVIYLVFVTFIPETKSIHVLIAQPGGILSLIWTIMITVKLFHLSKKPTNHIDKSEM